MLISSICLVTSKNETKNSPIHEFRPESFLKPLFNGVLFLIYYFKKHSQPCLFIWKALKDILQHFELVNWRFGYLISRTGSCNLRRPLKFDEIFNFHLKKVAESKKCKHKKNLVDLKIHFAVRTKRALSGV